MREEMDKSMVSQLQNKGGHYTVSIFYSKRLNVFSIEIGCLLRVVWVD